MWPQLAPPTVKAAVTGLYVIVVLVLVSLLTTVATASGGRTGSTTASLVVGDVVLIALLLAVARGLALGRPWARWTAAVVCVLGALSGFTLLTSGVGLVQVVAVVQILVFVGVPILLFLGASRDWFRPLP